jgi:EmrB/QacA subfamily drug resistance transporter
LPTIQRELGFSQSNLAWVVNAYLIAFAGLLLLSGRLGDLIGRKRVFLAGLVLFIMASLMCGLSTNQATLIVARFVQGVGGALGSAVILGMIVTIYTEPREQAPAIGIYSFVSAAGASIGLLANGFLTQSINWHWIFFINVPIGGVATLLGLRLLATDRGIGLREGADVVGAILVTGGLMLTVYTVVQATDNGWIAGRTLALALGSVVLLAAFVVREATAGLPLLPLRIFRSRPLSGANLIVVLMVAGLIGFQFLTALFLQRVPRYGPITTGLAFLPTPVLIAVVSLGMSARLIGRFGPRNVLLGGLVLIAVALGLAAGRR